MSGHFSVKNFESFQHYKDRSPPWIKLYNALLDNYEFGRLPDASKAHLLAIWLLASRYDNKIPHDAEWVGKRINATTTVDLDILEKSEFIILDQHCSKLLAKTEQAACPERERQVQAEREVEDTSLRSVSPAPAKAVAARPSHSEPEGFQEFYSSYPLHKGRRAAALKFAKALKRGTLEQILTGAARYKIECIGQHAEFIAHPATWLHQDRWLDEPSPERVSNGNGKHKPTAHDNFIAGAAAFIDDLQRDADRTRNGHSGDCHEVIPPLLEAGLHAGPSKIIDR